MQLFYTVRAGETVQQIAGRWKLAFQALIAANHLVQPYTVFPGQQLSIPPGVDRIRVRSGDTLYRLSQQYGVPLSLIIEANRLSPPYSIRTGQLLRIPSGVPFYVVQPGDSLNRIALRYHVTTAGRSRPDLIQLYNRLTSSDIYPGMRLIIPYAPPDDTGWIAYGSIRRLVTNNNNKDAREKTQPISIRYIHPSPDQPVEINHQAALIKRYPHLSPF